jgi:hypothetical protein
MSAVLCLGTLLWGVMQAAAFGANEPLLDQSVPLQEPSNPRPALIAPLDVARSRLPATLPNRAAFPRYYDARVQGERMRASPVPVAPTDPALTTPDSPWAAPTESTTPGTTPGFGVSGRPYASTAYGSAGLGAYATPTQPTVRSNAETFAQQIQASRLQAVGRPGAVLRSPKPFASYTPPPTTSPYMNLYRPTTNGVVNNYTEMVRPDLQQQSENQLVGRQIGGLRTAARIHSSILQQHGVSGQGGVPGYMNYGDYYQGVVR